MSKSPPINELHITTHQRGKMDQMISLNTSTIGNKFCEKQRQKKGTICSKCYAIRFQKIYKRGLNPRLAHNSKLLSERSIHKNNLPKFNALYVRFNSFGELINIIHLLNLLAICYENPKTTFTLWTKRLDLIKELINKPTNLIIVYSNPKINKVIQFNFRKYPMVDKVFTVFTTQYVRDNEIYINCKKSCFNCLICYQDHPYRYIYEVLK